ncbi:hypothetical protein ACGFW5_11025 [Streptomyces sp. NPDC048416]|uniref:hypothetical protein n=1 Tax=Streptomyces sp. NPDC048416 TaxID=3365546 RepID=UPI0037131EC7
MNGPVTAAATASEVLVSGPRLRAAPVDPVDAFTVLSPTEVSARKLVRADDPYLEGHYPDVTVYPGAFLIESVYQAVRHLVAGTRGPDTSVEPGRIDSVRFTTALGVGDTLDVHCTCHDATPGTLAVTARCTTGQARAAVVKMTFRLTQGPATTEEGPRA